MSAFAKEAGVFSWRHVYGAYARERGVPVEPIEDLLRRIEEHPAAILEVDPERCTPTEFFNAVDRRVISEVARLRGGR